ncbi:hypothetical protein [Paenarthrobacter sp. TE4293]|uniref:hypothetical protein n=1 Tax=Paenarthrobacter sp. TE4293 TaxID=3381695 RepID=UPI003D1EBB07
MDTIESLEPHAGELMVRVSYTCQACEASYAHNAAFHDVAAVLNRTGSVTGLLQFGGVYFHCGEPMTFANSSGRSVRAPLATEDADDGPAGRVSEDARDPMPLRLPDGAAGLRAHRFEGAFSGYTPHTKHSVGHGRRPSSRPSGR